MSGLSIHELTWLLARSGMTQPEIEDRQGPSPRAQSLYRKNPAAKSDLFQASIDRIAEDRFTFPWSPIIGKRIRRIVNLRDRRWITELRDEFELTVKLAELRLAEMSHTTLDWDEVDGLFGLRYFLGQYWLTLALHPQSNTDKTKARDKAIKHFRAFADELATAMEAQPTLFTEDVANTLLFKAAGNVVVIEWNAIHPKSARATNPALKALLEETRYFERVFQYSRIMPKVVTEPFNALAIASTFSMAEHYEELHAILAAADPNFADPDKVTASDFDEDFCNFKEWWKKEKQK